MTGCKSLRFILLPGLLCFALANPAGAATFTGNLSADDSVYTYNFNSTGTQLYNFSTTSYAAGGFDPVLTLFSSTTGNVIGFGGGSGTCTGSLMADPTTHLCNDANFNELLGPGSYTLDLTEFPNVANGNLAAGFLFAGSPTITGDSCGVSGGKFLETDVAPCVQRTSNFALAVTSGAAPTPEPSTLLLVFPALAGFVAMNRRRLAW